MIIGICGKLSSGKTTLVNTLKFKVLKIDELVSELHITFKDEIYNLFKSNNKKIIFDMILKSPMLEDKLRKIFFESVIQEIQKLSKENKVLIVEDASLFENSFNKYMDHIVYIHTPTNTCIENAMNKGKYDFELVTQILNSQLSSAEFKSKSDSTFYTSKDICKDVLLFNEFIENIIKGE